MIYDVLYKTLSGAKPLRIMFDKVDEFIRNYLVLCIFNRIRYLIKYKSSISYVSWNYEKIKIVADDGFPLERTFTLYNVVILFKSVFSKNHNQYYYIISYQFVSISSCQLAKT